MSPSYFRPHVSARADIEVSRSRFIGTLERVETAQEARERLEAIRLEWPGANHYVYAFRAGFPPSVIEGMSDDGEPSGTAGPPVLAVVRGSGYGDLMVVVVRYFGGTKLGTGGLVRAYTDTAKAVLEAGTFSPRRVLATVGVEVPYSLFDPVCRAAEMIGATVIDRTFTDTASLILHIERGKVKEFASLLTEISAGSAQLIELD